MNRLPGDQLSKMALSQRIQSPQFIGEFLVKWKFCINSLILRNNLDLKYMKTMLLDNKTNETSFFLFQVSTYRIPNIIRILVEWMKDSDIRELNRITSPLLDEYWKHLIKLHFLFSINGFRIEGARLFFLHITTHFETSLDFILTIFQFGKLLQQMMFSLLHHRVSYLRSEEIFFSHCDPILRHLLMPFWASFNLVIFSKNQVPIENSYSKWRFLFSFNGHRSQEVG